MNTRPGSTFWLALAGVGAALGAFPFRAGTYQAQQTSAEIWANNWARFGAGLFLVGLLSALVALFQHTRRRLQGLG